LYKQEEQDHGLEMLLDWKLLEAAQPALKPGRKYLPRFPIINTDRTQARSYQTKFKTPWFEGLPDDTIHFKFTGTAGQSLALSTPGVTLELEGDANDYFGKGLSGAKLIIYPSQQSTFRPEENSISVTWRFTALHPVRPTSAARLGTLCRAQLRRACSGGRCGRSWLRIHDRGQRGDPGRYGAATLRRHERRHCLRVQRERHVENLCNKEMVDLDPVGAEDADVLRDMIENHFLHTGSTVARFVLDDFDNQSGICKSVPQRL
jgi:glutamate synthase (NADPH/NADH) large chain